MWPGASPAWRKRQPNTKPRLGIKLQRPKSRLTANTPPLASSELLGINDDALSLSERQLDDGLDDAMGDEDAPAAATFNNGMWTPPAASSVASASPIAFTATAPIPSDASITDLNLSPTASIPSSTATSASSLPSTSATTSNTASTFSLSSASRSSTSSSSATPSPTDKTLNDSHSGGGGSDGFKLIYLTPILVFVGLFLVFSVGGRMWGRYHHASRVEAARRAKYDKRASRQAKKREMQRIKTMWGYDQTPMLPQELGPGEHDLHYKDPNAVSPTKSHSTSDERGMYSPFGSDSEAGASAKSSEIDEKYPGTFKILSLALLGEGIRPEPPETRGAGGRKYETGVQSNGWLAVKIRRWVGGDEKDLIVDDRRYTTAPNKTGVRRMRHALSRDRLRASVLLHTGQESDEGNLHSPTSTLSVGSGEMKQKTEFSSVDLTHANYQPNPYSHLDHDRDQSQTDDPFLTNPNQASALGWRKPLPPQPKESPFRPAILNFGLRSRSKQYDPIDPITELDTPVKRAAAQHSYADDAPAGFLPKTFGLGISGVWKTITGIANPTTTDAARGTTEDDEESFVGRPYRAHSDALMSENDTPYSIREAHGSYGDLGTPTKTRPLERAGTILNVRSTNQPWDSQQHEQAGSAQSSARKMTGAAWHEALLASPVNKQQQQQVFQPLVQPVSSSPTRPPRQNSSAPRKSLLLQQAVASAAAEANTNLVNAASPAPSSIGYSDLVACYSTPSDAVKSPAEASIRVLSRPPAAGSTDVSKAEESVGARQKLQRAKTAKYAHDERGQYDTGRVGDGDAMIAARPVQRSKTASTDASSSRSDARLGRKGTMHHSARDGLSRPLHGEARGSQGAKQARSEVYASPFTQPLRVSKVSQPQPQPQPQPVTSPASCYSSASSPSRGGSVSIPTRASSASPTKPSNAIFANSRTDATLPSALRIASPEPITSHLGQHQPLALPLLSHPHYHPDPSSSPPKRSKAVSNRSNTSSIDDHRNDEPSAGNNVAAAARSAALKAHNRNTALQTVDAIVYQGYAHYR